MRERPLALITSLSLLAGCTTTVNMAITNPTKAEHSVKAAIKNNGAPESEVALGSVKPSETLTKTLDIKHGRTLALSSRAQGYQAWEADPVTVLSKPNPLDVKVSISADYKLLNDADSVKVVTDAFLNLGKNYGLGALTAKQAIESYLGSLCLIRPPGKDDDSGDVIYRIPPSSFIGAKQTAQYARTNSTGQVDLSGSAAYTLSAGIPILKFSSAYSTDSVYHLDWSLNGFGTILATEPDGWTVLSALTALKAREKDALYELMTNNKDAVLLYVSRIWAIHDGSLNRTEAKKLAVDAKLDAASIVTTGGAYKLDSSTKTSQRFEDAVLNVGGDIVQATLLKASLDTPVKGQSRVTISGLEASSPNLKMTEASTSSRTEVRVLNAHKTSASITLPNSEVLKWASQ